VYDGDVSSPADYVSLSEGESIVLDVPEATSVITCTALDASGSQVGSSFEIDSTCDGERDLVLLQEFGNDDDADLLTFVGYVCGLEDGAPSSEEPETHFCIVEVGYSIQICNVGEGEMY
jgi:hypothetical protein